MAATFRGIQLAMLSSHDAVQRALFNVRHAGLLQSVFSVYSLAVWVVGCFVIAVRLTLGF